MIHGYPIVKKLCAELQDFMREHNFSSIEEFRGYATTPHIMIIVFKTNQRNYFVLYVLCFTSTFQIELLPQSSKDHFITKAWQLNCQ
jgi:hypothetical protein